MLYIYKEKLLFLRITFYYLEIIFRLYFIEFIDWSSYYYFLNQYTTLVLNDDCKVKCVPELILQTSLYWVQ